MKANRVTLTNGVDVPEVRTSVTTMSANITNSGVVTVTTPTGQVIAQLASGDQATDYQNGILSNLYSFTFSVPTDRVYVSAFIA